jgi:hypothetical protein
MRMRKLGSDHSILFFASGEIMRKIRLCSGHRKRTLDSSDVLLWALRETCEQITQNGALWASQGENFDRRCAAWDEYEVGALTQLEVADVLREPESRTLEELYGVRDGEHFDSGEVLTVRQKKIWMKCKEFGIGGGQTGALLEEQERELAHEKEEERQVERAVGATPLRHFLDPALVRLVKSGNLEYIRSLGLKVASLFRCLQETTQASALSKISTDFFQSELLFATEDFFRTVDLSSGDSMDDFLRPVQWVLSTTIFPNTLLLLSPFEANELLPHIRSSRYVSLHVYAPRTSRKVRSIENLDFFTVPRRPEFILPPRHVMHELNLFAGQLFFGDRASFQEVCDMLGLYLGEVPDRLRGKIDTHGFVKDKHTRQIEGIGNCCFSRNPIVFLRELIGWRRKGLGFTLTHVGLILHGNNLAANEFVE